MGTKDPLAMLGSVSLFEGLSKKELGAILRQSKGITFPAGKTIVKEGESGVGFHLIVEGTAKVSVRGRTRATLRRGDFFGELSLIDRGRRTATVKAETPVRTLSLASWEFLPLLDKNPPIARKILVEVCRRLRAVERSPIG